MAVHVISCYFLPFLFFFFAQIAFPKSIAAFALGISALSISCLILYFKILDQKNSTQEIRPQSKKEPLAEMPAQTTKIAVESSPKITHQAASPIVDFAKKALHSSPKAHLPNTKAIIAELQQALTSQQSLFTEELEKRTYALAELPELHEALNRMQQALQAKEAEVHAQSKEIEDLKFELYTLLRIESYVSPQKEQDVSKLAAASF